MAASKRTPYVAVFTARPAKGARARRQLEALRQALAPESGRGLPGATVHLKSVSSGRALEIRIEATNLRALRASVNSYLRWSALAEEVASAAEEE